MSRWPKAVLQFEDFQLSHAHPLLQRYKDQHLVFNDDIQVMLDVVPVAAMDCSLYVLQYAANLKGNSASLHSI